MNKRIKYVIKEVSIECLGSIRKRLVMSGKFVLSVPRRSLASEIVHVFNKSSKPMYGQLSVWYEVDTVPACVNTKSVLSLSDFVEALS